MDGYGSRGTLCRIFKDDLVCKIMCLYIDLVLWEERHVGRRNRKVKQNISREGISFLKRNFFFCWIDFTLLANNCFASMALTVREKICFQIFQDGHLHNVHLHCEVLYVVTDDRTVAHRVQNQHQQVCVTSLENWKWFWEEISTKDFWWDRRLLLISAIRIMGWVKIS